MTFTLMQYGKRPYGLSTGIRWQRLTHVSMELAFQKDDDYDDNGLQIVENEICTNASYLIFRYYFSLQAPSSKEEIYSSELQSTSNPNWVDMEPENIKPINRQSLRGNESHRPSQHYTPANSS